MQTKDHSFPFKRVFNLLRLIDLWRESADSASEAIANHARSVLALLDSAPDLLAEEIDVETIKKHTDVLSVLMSPVIPSDPNSSSIVGATPPFQPECFYATDAFARLNLLDEFDANVRVSGTNLTAGKLETARATNAYMAVLQTFYGASPDMGFPFIITKIDETSGLPRHYKLEVDSRFVEIKVKGELKQLSKGEIEHLLKEAMNLDLWMSTLPPEQFEFHGFGVFTATDVTVQEELSLVKDDLLKPGSLASPQQLDILENRLRVILGRPQLRLGVMSLERSEFGAIEGARPAGRSLLMSEEIVPVCDDKAESFYAKAFESDEVVIVSSLDACSGTCTGFERHLMKQGLKNLLIAPLTYEDERVGLLELASPNPGDINSWNANKLLHLTHLFATALNRELRERENLIQAVIKKHYTAIHPSVEWRFRESAIRYMEQLNAGGRPDKEEIVFQAVYPLYGLSDIRDSSTHRVDAIREDLMQQLRLAADVVVAASDEKNLPVLDELKYQIEEHIHLIEKGLTSGDEVSILEFVRVEIEERLDHLSSFGQKVTQAVESYRNALDPELGLVYESRKAYEESVGQINQAIAQYLEAQDERAQAMFPHYFERYQTDGVEYNIYVGDSLVEKGGFDPLYLRNLRLWQLMTTCGIVWEMNALKSRLPVALDTAHLLLVQSTPLAVRFREDEKQFDVDGAYNARYEIVKKRIDKAVIRGTGERLTQPGQIAITYAQTKEALEYRRYLQYLRAAGYIEGEIEDHELEDLQGVTGLRALRVKVTTHSPDVMFEVTPDGTVRPAEHSPVVGS